MVSPSPGIVLWSFSWSDRPSPEHTVVRQVAHQWFGRILGYSIVEQPWLAHGPAEYATQYYYADRNNLKQVRRHAPSVGQLLPPLPKNTTPSIISLLAYQSKNIQAATTPNSLPLAHLTSYTPSPAVWVPKNLPTFYAITTKLTNGSPPPLNHSAPSTKTTVAAT